MPGGRVGGGGHASGGGGGHISGGGRIGGGGHSSGGWSSGGSSWGGSHSSGGWSSGSWSGGHHSSAGSSSYQPTHYPTYVRPVVFYGGGGGGGSHHNNQNSGGNGGGNTGCLNGSVATVLVIFLVITFLLIFFSALEPSSGDVTASTVNREPLASGAVDLTGYYEDSTGLIRRSSVLQEGMRHFYEKTGVQPFLYVTKDINGSIDPSDAELERYAQELYSQLFTDSAHFLMIIYDADDTGFYYYYIPGNAAKTVMDPEAMEIFEGYVYQDSPDYLTGDAESYFSEVFAHTADRIMQVTRSSALYMGIALAVIAVLALLFHWWRKAKEQKNKENEHMQHVLDSDIEELIKDPELQDLEDKYGKEDASEKPKTEAQPKPQPKPEPKKEDDGFKDVDLKDPALAELEKKYGDE